MHAFLDLWRRRNIGPLSTSFARSKSTLTIVMTSGRAAGIQKSRVDAGRKLGARLLKYKDQNPVILGVPRGGVPVAFEVARALNAPLDVIVVRKLGAPGQSELGIGAVVDGHHPETILNREVVSALRVSRDYLEREVHNQQKEIHRRNQGYRRDSSRIELKDRTVIVVDDGIATGGSIRAALRGVRQQKPKRVVLAVPVGPADTIESLRGDVDEIVCLSTPPIFFGSANSIATSISWRMRKLSACSNSHGQGSRPLRRGTKRLCPHSTYAER